MTSALGWVGGLITLAAYALEDRSKWWTLAFAAGCLVIFFYGVALGAWPIIIFEAVWIAVALYRFGCRCETGY